MSGPPILGGASGPAPGPAPQVDPAAIIGALLPTLEDMPINFIPVSLEGPKGPRVAIFMITPVGTHAYLMPPDAARGMGEAILREAQRADSPLLLPPKARLV